MSNNQIKWQGLFELRAALRRLPEELAREAQDLIEDTVETTAAQLREAYPVGDTGNLRKGIKTTIQRDRFSAVGEVKSTSKHAHLWEFGTQNRQTREGWNRGRGPHHYNQGLIGIASRERRKLNAKLIELVRRAGFEVTGSF